MKTITALAAAFILCVGFAATASAHGWHGHRGWHGYRNNVNMNAEGYGNDYRGGGPCWFGWGRNDPGPQYERRDSYRDNRRMPERDYPREGYRDDGYRGERQR